MSKFPDDVKYTSTHEWVRVEGDLARIGISDFAQHELGDVVFVELPSAGTTVTAKNRFGTIESVKAASDLFSPVSGQVVEINAALTGQPELVNDDPYGEGWMMVVRLKDKTEVGQLLDAAGYRQSTHE